jgi:dCTP deaminase
MEFTIDPAADGFSFQAIASEHHAVSSRRGWVGRVEAGQVPSRPYGGAVHLPLESGLAARVEGGSTLARCGVGIHITAPTIHTGSRGTLTLEITNHGTLPMRLRPGLPICQLIVEQVVRGIEGELRSSFQNQDTVAGPSRQP